MLKYLFILFLFGLCVSPGCGKKNGMSNVPPPPAPFNFNFFTIDNQPGDLTRYNINTNPVIRLGFTSPVNRTFVPVAISFTDRSGAGIQWSVSYEKSDSIIVIRPSAALNFLSSYKITIGAGLKSIHNVSLQTEKLINFNTKIDSSRKYSHISDDSLLTLVQKQTFKYFWDFGHPVSGMARERNTSGETVTSGGTGFGIMAIPVAINRGFITRAEGLSRLEKIVNFLKNAAPRFHGAFSHWINGSTGAVIPFSSKDDGADLVETSFLMMGLLTARQYFNDPGTAETTLRNNINELWNAVEWNWFRKGGQDVLFWHWSPVFNWDINLPIRGWNEALITYVLASSSTTYPVPVSVYNNGWKNSSNFLNGNSYYGYQLPLGPAQGGPLFFEHYSFLGINPNGLNDASANYGIQARNHSLINYQYCKTNPKQFFGYSDSVWGLTASDIEGGYTASSPTNDRSFIAPTAAISSIPFTPAESVAALKFYYYVLGDKLWKEYGFVDAFSLHNLWFANSFLAIDQGPIIIMIENYRSGLLWNLFTSCPEVKAGMMTLGFSAPYL